MICHQEQPQQNHKSYIYLQCLFASLWIHCSFVLTRWNVTSFILGEGTFFPTCPNGTIPLTHCINLGISTSPNLLTPCSTALLCLHHDEESANCRQPGLTVVFLGKHSRKSGQIQGESETHQERLSCVSLGWRPFSSLHAWSCTTVPMQSLPPHCKMLICFSLMNITGLILTTLWDSAQHKGFQAQAGSG